MTFNGSTAGATFPQARRTNVSTDAICSSFIAGPTGGISPIGPSLPDSNTRIAAVGSVAST